MLLRLLPHYIKRVCYPGCNNRILHHRIGADDVDGFAALLGGELGEGEPGQLEDGGGIFAAAVADNPRHVVSEVEFADFGLEGFERGLEAESGEGGVFRGGFFGCGSSHNNIRD